jgi:putative ABC transport system substrate-binding protein
MIGRRKFITLLGGAAAWPLAARAQRSDRVWRISMLMGWSESDPAAKAVVSGFKQGLSELGWTDGGNVQIVIRWGAGNVERMQALAKELVHSQPDLILTQTTPATAALQQETQTIPIIFVGVVDPVGSGFVAGLPRPGRNITGFINYEPSLAGKWLELLRGIDPALKRAAIMFNPATAPFGRSYFLPSFEASARLLNLEPKAAEVHSDAEIETAITSLGSEPNSGLVVMPDGYMVIHREQIISAAARYKVPAIYDDLYFVREGGLVGYGPSEVDIFRRSASYVDRILHGERPTDLPVQLPIKFEMALNTKAARALGLTVPPNLLAIADEVIE